MILHTWAIEEHHREANTKQCSTLMIALSTFKGVVSHDQTDCATHFAGVLAKARRLSPALWDDKNALASEKAPKRCMMEDTFTMRPLLSQIWRSRSLVSKNGARWFACSTTNP